MSRAFRSSAIAVTYISRQFGVQINVDAVTDAVERSGLSTPKDFINYFYQFGVSVKLRKFKPADLIEKKYIYPCVGVMKDGRSLILAGVDVSDQAQPKMIAIDPLDPTAKAERINALEFQKSWSGQIVLATRSSGEASKDREFDWKWFLPELWRFKGIMAMTFIVSLIIHALGVAPIIYIQISLDKVLGYQAVSTLYVLTSAIVLALLFGGIITYGRDYVINYISTTIESRITGDVFDKLLDLPAQTFQTSSAMEMEGKVQAVLGVRSFLSRQVLTNLYDATGILVFTPILFGYSPVLTLVVIGFAVLQGLIDLFSKLRQRELAKTVGEANMKRISNLRETISGIDSVKTLSQESIQRKEWRSSAASSIRRNFDSLTAGNMTSAINGTLSSLMTVAIVFTGINLVFAGSLSAGAIISCNMLGGKIVSPIKGLITFFADTSTITGAMDQLKSVWNANPERASGGSQHVITGNLELRDVKVKFGDHEALAQATMSIPARKKVAIVGPSASGKSTLLRLLQGLLKPNEGLVEVDGNNLASLDLTHYRSQVALVDLAPTFFSGTIEQNIRRVRPNISVREFDEVIENSGLGILSKDLSDGLSTELDLTGGNLAQGHKISVALARALATDPNLLMLDETFNTMDKKTQVYLKSKMDQIAAGKTLIATIHDFRWLSQFDWIVVLENGSVVGQGEHDDLMKNCPLYVEMWELEKKIADDM
ncbi:MAG: peptidase domain-containing ABC transporter [Rhodospirillales bacterium]|tara:strand:- start:1929 stop:4067 length:2139 start_codon:yes stop_codon:yes gene_type:complete